MSEKVFPKSPEGPIPATESARSELMEGLASAKLVELRDSATALIAGDEKLHKMISRLIESGPELDISIQAHLRRMIALRSSFVFEEMVESGAERDYWALIGEVTNNIDEEFDELDPKLGELPDLWDIAYEDLLRLEG